MTKTAQEIRKELGIPLDAKVVLSVGEVNKNKNHKVGIEALAKLNDPDVYYVICGRGPLIKNWRRNLESGIESFLQVTERMWLISTRWQMFSCSPRSEKDFQLR